MITTTKILALSSLFVISACAPKYEPYAPISVGYDGIQRVQAFEGDNPLSPFISAMLAERDSDELLAASYYLRALENDPKSSFVAEKAFFQLVTAGQIERASELAPNLFDVDTISPLSRLVLATKALKNRDSSEVILQSIEVQKTPLGYIFGPLIEAWGHAIAGDEEAALQVLSAIKGHQVILNIAKANTAYILDYMGEIDRADAAYKALISSNTLVSLQPIVAYGDFLYRNNRNQQARDMFAAEIKKHNNNMFILREAQRHILGHGPTMSVVTPEGALANFYFRMASEGFRDRPDLLSLFYGRLAEYLSPISEDIKLLIGEILIKLERPAAAARAYAAIPQNSPASGAAFLREIDALKAAENYGVAEALLRKELLKRPNDRRLLSTLADLYRIRGSCDQAIQYYDTIINTANGPMASGFAGPTTNQWFNYFARGSCHELEGSWALGEADLLFALQLAPDNAMVQNYLGYSWLSRGIKLERAKTLIEKAASKEPENGSIIDSLGWVQYQMNDFSLAVTSLEKAVKLSPDNATINDHLGDAYWQVGRLREARFQWRNALATVESDADRSRIREKMIFGLLDQK